MLTAERGRTTARVAAAPLATLAVLITGALLRAEADTARVGWMIWYGGLVVIGAPVIWRTVLGMMRGHFASDVVAMLSIATAIVMRPASV